MADDHSHPRLSWASRRAFVTGATRVGGALREAVINAIKHGNRQVENKQITVEFTLTPAGAPTRLAYGSLTRARVLTRLRSPTP